MNTRHLDIPETIFAFAVPLLPARDVDATVAFFEGVLGFRRSHSRGATARRFTCTAATTRRCSPARAAACASTASTRSMRAA
jgi:hypothetical protein